MRTCYFDGVLNADIGRAGPMTKYAIQNARA